MTAPDPILAGVFPAEKLLLCVSGGVSAALIPSWILWAQGAHGLAIRVVLTRAAESFVSATALRAITGYPVATDDNRMDARGRATHLELAAWPDAVLIAPATANTIAKLSAGVADNLLSNTLLSVERPVVIAPSFSGGASRHPSTTRNLETLAGYGWEIVHPIAGWSVTDRTQTPGAMPDAPTVFEAMRLFLTSHRHPHTEESPKA